MIGLVLVVNLVGEAAGLMSPLGSDGSRRLVMVRASGSGVAGVKGLLKLVDFSVRIDFFSPLPLLFDSQMTPSSQLSLQP